MSNKVVTVDVPTTAVIACKGVKGQLLEAFGKALGEAANDSLMIVPSSGIISWHIHMRSPLFKALRTELSAHSGDKLVSGDLMIEAVSSFVNRMAESGKLKNVILFGFPLTAYQSRLFINHFSSPSLVYVADSCRDCQSGLCTAMGALRQFQSQKPDSFTRIEPRASLSKTIGIILECAGVTGGLKKILIQACPERLVIPNTDAFERNLRHIGFKPISLPLHLQPDSVSNQSQTQLLHHP